MNNNRFSTIELREAFFMGLYQKAFPAVARYVAKMGGSLEEAQDIFQDTLLIYYEKVTSGRAENIVSERAYLLGIAQIIWLQRFKTSSKHQPLADFDAEVLPDQPVVSIKIYDYLQAAGQKCMELLKAYYYDRVSADNAATLFGYSSARSVTVAKYKCLEKIRETVKQNSLDYADFIE